MVTREVSLRDKRMQPKLGEKRIYLGCAPNFKDRKVQSKLVSNGMIYLDCRLSFRDGKVQPKLRPKTKGNA